MQQIKVLLVEDEAVLAQVVQETLETKGFNVITAANGVEGWNSFTASKPDICIVDVMMPRKDGLSLVIDIRKVDEDIPIIFLTAKTQTTDVIKGLEIGADDYIKKPFSIEELILRIQKLVRRSKKQITETIQTITTIGKYAFDQTRLHLSIGNKTTTLSQREADLLLLLVINKNKLLERKTALLKLWGEDDFFNARSMDVFITRLRKYLHEDENLQIINVRGKGYKLVD